MLIEIKEKIINNLRNIPGWNTNRRIIVFESDDWGAIRMPSKKVYNKLLSKGVSVDKSPYNVNDSLECNHDLEALYNVLIKHKDRNGNHPVFTALCIVANPNFEAIEKNNFINYEYEPVLKTLEKYGATHNKVHKLYKEGIESKIFHPEFHGREHINVKRWMNAIKNDSISRLSFEMNFYGMGFNKPNEINKNHFAAFDIDTIEDLIKQKVIIKDGLSLFNQIHGYSAHYFVPPNFFYNSQLENFLLENEIYFLPGSRRHMEPVGSGKFKKSLRYTGLENKIGQTYLVRNVQFEPTQTNNIDAWANALKDIKTAFFWKKPVIISSHRLNYIGFINEENRKSGLNQLNLLLKNIIKKWPDVEFMTSNQLVELIKK
jgi:hypothetical protein